MHKYLDLFCSYAVIVLLWQSSMTVPTSLKELNKIEIIRQADGVYRLDHAVTATQKDILQAFNMAAATVKKEAATLGKTLEVLTN
jgi:hypothetical protein